MSWALINRLFFEYRSFLLWVLIFIVGAIFFLVMYRQTQPEVVPVPTPDTNVYL